MDVLDEAELLRAWRAGRVLDCADGDSRRTAAAAALRRCCRELKDQIEPRGIRLQNAVVAGQLELAGFEVPFPLRFDGCEFESAPVVEGAQLLVLVTASLATPAGQATLRATTPAGTVYTTSGLLRPGSGPVPHADSCGDGQVRCFEPVLYAIDTVVPLVSLDKRATWYPDPHVRDGAFMQWWLNIATVLGWLLSSIFVLSFARLALSA